MPARTLTFLFVQLLRFSLLKQEDTNCHKSSGCKDLVRQLYKHAVVFPIAQLNHTGQRNTFLDMLLY